MLSFSLFSAEARLGLAKPAGLSAASRFERPSRVARYAPGVGGVQAGYRILRRYAQTETLRISGYSGCISPPASDRLGSRAACRWRWLCPKGVIPYRLRLR